MVPKLFVGITATLPLLLSACQALSLAPTPTPLPTPIPLSTPTPAKTPTPRVITIVVTPTPDIAAYVSKQLKLQWAHRIIDFLIMDAERISRQNRWVNTGGQARSSSEAAKATITQFWEQLANMDDMLLDVTPADEGARQIREAFLKYTSKVREAQTEFQGYYAMGDQSRRARSNAITAEANALRRKAYEDFEEWERMANISTSDYGSRKREPEQWTR